MFDEVRFPEDISYGAIGGPEFSTEISTSLNGLENRNINWLHSKMKYNISHCIKSKDQLEKLLEFFYARMGKAIGFRFKDWMDFSGQNQVLYNKTQLVKIYISGNRKYMRKITKPVKNTVIIYVDNKVYEEEFHIDYTTGQISFQKMPTGTLSSNFEFDVPVRFDTDYLAASIDEYNTYSWRDIHLVELK